MLWRLLPEKYGDWNSVYKRFARWCDHGVWDKMHHHFADDPDSIVPSFGHIRVQRVRPKKRGQAKQALGRSRGGFSTKIHVSVDGLGNPLRFILTAGQRHDITQAQELVIDFDFEQLIGDTAYDADHFRQFILEQKEAEPVIPSSTRRNEPYDYDDYTYRERHLVECFINKIKHYRRIFSRFDKLASRYLGFLNFVGALIWFR